MKPHASWGLKIEPLLGCSKVGLSDAVYSVDTVKVKPAAGDKYLEGLEAIWVASLEIQKKLGHVKDYAIHSRMTPQIADFNLMLVTEFKSMEAMRPAQAKLDAYLKEMGKEKAEAGTKRALEDYPELREITGSYHLNEFMMRERKSGHGAQCHGGAVSTDAAVGPLEAAAQLPAPGLGASAKLTAGI